MKGFTLIELLVVIGISAMLSGIALVYTGIARNETALSVESAKVSGFIMRAKDLSLATYVSGVAPGTPRICGYGASFNLAQDTYSIFTYRPAASKYPGVDVTKFCPSIASTTEGGISVSEMTPASVGTWNVPLANGVKMESGGQGDDLAAALFFPPDPTALISRVMNGSTFVILPKSTPNMTSRVYLVTADGSASTTVSVNGAGQISF